MLVYPSYERDGHLCSNVTHTNFNLSYSNNEWDFINTFHYVIRR